MGEFQEGLAEVFGKTWAKVLMAIFGLIVIYFLFAVVFSFWPLSVGRDVVNKVVNANAIIYNYEWFYDQYNAIQAQMANLKAMPRGSYERRGLIMVLNNMIAEYNSKSRQMTRNLWKPNDPSLPYQIEMEVDE